MKSEWKKLEGNIGELKVEFAGEEWTKAQDKAFNKIAKTVRIPGFRDGKAPKAMIKQRVNKMAVMQDAMDALLNANYTKILTDNDVAPIAQPTLTIDEINEKEIKLTFKIEVKPEITLGQYKGFGIEKETVEVTDEEIVNELKNMQQQFAELTVKEEGEVEDGDTAVIDFEGFVDGEAFEGGKGEQYPLSIGSGSFIPGFEEQLIGMKANETKDVVVTFPEEYQEASLAGKEAVFKVCVHEIKFRTLPELEDLPQEANIDGVKTLDDLKLNIKTRMTNQKEAAAEERYTDELYNKLIDATPIDLPEALVNNEIEGMMNEVRQNIQNQGLDFETFQKLTGKGIETIKEELRPQAEKRAKLNLILEAVVKAENLEVTEEEIEEEIKAMATTYGEDFEKLKPLLEGVKPQISAELMMRKALNVIRDNA